MTASTPLIARTTPASPLRAKAPRTKRPNARVALITLVVAAAFSAAPARAVNIEVPGCGNLANAFGPWDYRSDRGEPLTLVESAHFTPNVEALIRGQSSTVIGQDLDYTLRAFPNHHRALVAAARYADRSKSNQPPGMHYSIDCWFERAVRFKPDDFTARMLYGDWLAKHKRRDEALKQLAFVQARAGDNAFVHYNLGLVYLELGEHEAALQQAHQALALGMPRQELKNALQSTGKWSDPPAAAAAPASAAASAP